MNVLIALLALLLSLCCLTAGLLVLRSRRKAQRFQKLNDLPFQAHSPTSKSSQHRNLTIATTPYGRFNAPITTYAEKEVLMQKDSPSSPTDSLPEIRITFPDEEDEGRRKSGRVVTVRISEKGGVGLEPFNDEHLPPYQQSDSERFHSLDLERMGGLKELEKAPKM